MIPKNLFIIWLSGSDKPEYVDHTVNAYKQLNPDFSVNLVEDFIEHPKIQCVKQMIELYDNKVYGKPIQQQIFQDVKTVFENEMSSFSGKHGPFLNNKILSISHILRVYLTYRYGGIFVDADTFPVKPFDEYILSEDFQSFHDNFWHGCHQGSIITNNNQEYQRKEIGKYIRTIYENFDGYEKYNSNNFSLLQRKFFNCEIKIGDKVLPNYRGRDYYIDHYHSASWKK